MLSLLRIELPGTLYHIAGRENERNTIYLNTQQNNETFFEVFSLLNKTLLPDMSLLYYIGQVLTSHQEKEDNKCRKTK
jgi:hypothetical protein